MNHPTAPILCVTTNKCPSVGSTSNNNDAIQLICPFTGSSLSNTFLRIGSGIGVHSLVPIPNTNAYVAYGGKDDQDLHAMLLILGSFSPSWRCRLTEPMQRFIVSPCGMYTVGAGKSGRLYCWSTFHNGKLLRIWTAHYRQVNQVCFSDCGSYLVTGGVDGIVHVWSLMDIVEESSRRSDKAFNPIRTWSLHHLPITALHALNSSRILSGSSDRQIIIMEIFSAQTLARIQVPTPITAVTTDSTGHRLYVGGDDGRIFLIDLDTYALATTAESATLIRTGYIHSHNIAGETIQGKESASYISELHGHDQSITSLSLIESAPNIGDVDDLLISGGIDGIIRVWDVRARCCVRILHPWSSSLSHTTQDTWNPCTSITIVPRSFLDTDVSRNSTKRKNSLSLESVIMPLQRFAGGNQGNSDPFVDPYITIPIRPWKKFVPSITFEEYDITPNKNEKTLKNEGKEISSDPINEEDSSVEISRLRQELQEARETIERWQKVNNRLAQRLKNSS